MKLSQLSLVLGIGMVLTHALALLQVPATTRWLRRFPRNVPAGIVLMLVGMQDVGIVAVEKLADGRDDALGVRTGDQQNGAVLHVTLRS